MFTAPSVLDLLSREFTRVWPDAEVSVVPDRKSMGDVVLIRVRAKGREATGNLCVRQSRDGLIRDLKRLCGAVEVVIDNIRDNAAHDVDMAGRMEAAMG